MNILVSGCLLGIPCRYDGTGRLEEGLRQLMKYHNLIPVCPEQLGGLPTPRKPAEKRGDQVCDRDGADVTASFERGAEAVRELAGLYGCRLAILKERSPSCGCGVIYDGSFSKTLISGDGVTAAMLKADGIKVMGESKLSSFLESGSEENEDRNNRMVNVHNT